MTNNGLVDANFSAQRVDCRWLAYDALASQSAGQRPFVPGRDRSTHGDVFAGHVHHAGGAGGVDVGQFVGHNVERTRPDERLVGY